MKKLIKSRKGAAMELAIGVMFLMMAFTIMLLSTSGLQNSLRVDDYEDFNEMVEVNNIGEHVVANYNPICSCDDYNTCDHYSTKKDNENNPITKKIIIDGEDTGYTVTVKNIALTGDAVPQFEIKNIDGETVLTIVVSGGEITSWN